MEKSAAGWQKGRSAMKADTKGFAESLTVYSKEL